MYSLKPPHPVHLPASTRAYARRSQKFNQRGVTLIELMIGIVIGLLVVVAAIGSLVFTQLTSTVVGDSARLQQTADAAFRNLSFQISQAGALSLTPDIGDPAALGFSNVFTGYDPAITGAAAGQIFSFHGLDGASNAPDTLRVSYQDNMLSTDTAADQTAFGVRDCLGARPNAALNNVRVDNEFSVANEELMCLGSGNASAQSIASGVEDFQVTYGVLTLNAGAPQYRFYRADEILDWTNVQAVTICLQLSGENKGNPQPGLALTGCRGQSITSDGKLRRIFWRTFSARNALL